MFAFYVNYPLSKAYEGFPQVDQELFDWKLLAYWNYAS